MNRPINDNLQKRCCFIREGAVMGPPNTAVLVHRVDRLLTRAARWSDLRLPWRERVGVRVNA